MNPAEIALQTDLTLVRTELAAARDRIARLEADGRRASRLLDVLAAELAEAHALRPAPLPAGAAPPPLLAFPPEQKRPLTP